MDISTILFIIISFGSLIAAFILEGGKMGGLLIGTAAMIVFGGTIGAVGVSFPTDILKRLPGMFKVFVKPQKYDMVGRINYFKEISFKVRKEGILSLESEINLNGNIDPFIKKGLQLVADGIENESVRSILELEAENTSERHREGIAMFEAAGGYAPTMGVIGTVMGLVNVLSNLSDPASLGPKIAVAFVATLYGVSSANLLWLPIAAKLKAFDNKELKDRSLIIDAIVLIQQGVNPNTLAEKLKGYLDKKEVLEFEKNNKGVAV